MDNSKFPNKLDKLEIRMLDKPIAENLNEPIFKYHVYKF